MISEIMKLLHRVGAVRKYYFLLILRAPFDILFTVIQAVFLKEAFSAIEQKDSSTLAEVCIIFGIVSCLLFLYNGTMWRMFGAMYIRIGGKLRKILLQTISRQPLTAIEQKSQGDILTRMNQDADMALQLLGGPLNIPHLIVALINVGVSSVILCAINVRILLLVWLFVLPHIFLNRVMISKPMTLYQTEVQKAVGASTNLLGSMIISADTAILYDAQDYLLREYEKSSRDIYKARMRIVKRNTMGSAMIPLFGLGGYLVLLVTGADSIARGSLSFGELIAAFQYRGGILSGAMMVISCMVNMRMNLSGVIRVNEMTVINVKEKT